MNQSPRGHTRGKSSGGSVRRARERVEAGLPSETFSPYRPARQLSALEGPRPAPPPPSGPRPILKNPLSPPRNVEEDANVPVAMVISRPTPTPQWPLPAAEGDNPTDKFVADREYQPPPGRSIPPQRPPRPSHVPSILDASKTQDHIAAFPYIPQQRAAAQAAAQQMANPRFPDNNQPSLTDSPNLKSPQSRPSTVSSVGTIPDFPIPAIPPPAIPARKSTNLGPPPSSRRGASSYYSQTSFVSPIPEESDRSRSHGSYASSAAIPSSWGSSSPVPYYEGEISPGLSEDYSDFEIVDEGPDNRESRSDDGDESGLVRKASLGKRGKPSLISTRSLERVEPFTSGSTETPDHMPTDKVNKMGVFGIAEMKAAIANATTPQVVTTDQRHTKWPSVDDSNSTNTMPSVQSRSTQSSETVPTLLTSTFLNNVPPVPRMPPSLGLARADSDTIGSPNTLRPALQQSEPSRFSRLSAIRRPPRLNIDAVREAEARGSLTSLPDLIKRATRLAALMDSGKRPGSRLNDLNDFPSDSESGFEKGFPEGQTAKRRSGLSMLSDILSAFPPPGLGTPRNQSPRGQRPMSQWPEGFNGSPLAHSDEQQNEKSKKGRRCCGVSLCCFLIFLLIGLIIIAAAVVIPLELVVLHKHKPNSSTSSTTSAASSTSSCESTLTCLNGGTNSIASGICSCICTNGFTGSTCAEDSSVGCTTANFTDSNNVTIGEAIPRLISASETNFSIPLTSSIIISRFNSGNLTCTSENALVTFDGEDERSGSSSDTVSSSATSTTAAAKVKRADDFYVTNSFSGAATATTSARAVATSNGIISDPSATSGSATSTASSAKASATFAVTENILDFARVAVLYVLEKQSVDMAVTAQSQLQTFLTNGGTNSDASNVTVGNGHTVDLVSLKIDLGNGTVGGTGQSLSRRSRILK